MNRKRLKNLLRTLLPAACLLGGTAREANASSYATQLSNNNGTISFRLNDAADNVTIKSGATTVELGPLPAGVTTRDLTAQGIGAGAAFEVSVFKIGTGAISPIGSNVPMNAARGVSVNVNPASEFFGRVYVANTAAGTGTTPRGDGIYIFNSDMTETFEQGAAARTGGLSFAGSTTASPYRLKVGQDDNRLYITDWSDATGNLYVADPDVTTGSFALKQISGATATPATRPVGEQNNHGSIVAAEVLGTLAGSDLRIFSVDEDYQTDPTSTVGTEQNSLWRYDVGAGPLPWEAAPNQKLFTPLFPSTSQTVDLAYSKVTTYFYVSQRRTNGTEPNLYVVDETGAVLWNSLVASRAITAGTADFLADSYGVAVTRDARYIAVIAGNNIVTVMPMGIDGLPDIAARVRYTGFATTTGGARSIAFDAANNLYVVADTSVTAGSGLDVTRALSLGFTAEATTSSAGTFTLTIPDASVSATLVNDVATIREGDTANTAAFRIARAGGNTAEPLVVNFTVAGTGARGATGAEGDFHLKVGGVTLGNATSVTIPAGEDNVVIEVVPNADAASELSETIVFNLSGGIYNAVAPLGGTITILDNNAQTVDISALTFNQMFESNQHDRIRLTLQRRGALDAAAYDVNLAYAGTATAETDFTPVTTVTFEPDQVTKTVDIFPINDTAVEGPETVIISVGTGAGYTAGTNFPLTAGANGLLTDDDNGPEEVLWSDTFLLSSIDDYIVRFGSTVPDSNDYRAEVGFDYNFNLQIPQAPNTADPNDTAGLFVTVNKNTAPPATVGKAAGVNLYPRNQTFSGNYALRFDMYLLQNTGAATTENAIFGINHTTENANWFARSGAGVPAGTTYDGVVASVQSDASNELPGDYTLFSGPAVLAGTVNGPTYLETRASSTLRDVFHNPPWTPGGGAGSPGNIFGSETKSWAQVELSQVDGTITLKINNVQILSRPSPGPTSGDVMFGYVDAFDSVPGTASARVGSVIYDNVRVVRIANVTPSTINITSTALTGGNLAINFTSTGNEPASAFKLFSSTTVNGTFAEDTTAGNTLTATANGYQATTPASGAARFFMIRKAP